MQQKQLLTFSKAISLFRDFRITKATYPVLAPLTILIFILLQTNLSLAQDADAPLGDLIKTVAGDSTLMIQDTDYSFPDDAIFIATTGDDVNSGSVDAPVKSFTKALSLVSSGGTIVFREGVYRHFNDIRIQKKVTLQPYPHEKVWIKGSIIIPTEQWVSKIRDGKEVWHKANWTFEPRREDTRDPKAIDPAKPMSKYTDMVFIDGKPLQQVATLAEVRDAVATPTEWKPATFYVDSVNDTLYIGKSPEGKTVEAAAYERALFIDGPGRGTTGTTIRGLGFTHFAYAGLHSFAHQLVLEKNTFGWNAVYGFSFDGTVGTNIRDTYIQIRKNWINYNGRKGFHANKANKLIVEGNIVAYNNTELFAMWWDAGGMKIMRSENILVYNNIALNNKSIGIWLDINNYNAKVYNNYAQGNSSIGIFYEVGRWATIAGNIAVGNGQGIQVSGSRNVTIFNNTTVDNITEIAIIDANRRPEQEGVLRAGSDWETRDVVIKNNVFSHSINKQDSRDKSFVNCWKDPITDKIPMITSLDYNGYYRRYTAMPLNLWRISPWPTSYDAKFNTIEALREETDFEDNGFLIDGEDENPFFVSSTDFRLKEGSQAVGAGEILPDSIASLLNWPTGVRVNMGAYQGIAPNQPTSLNAVAVTPLQIDLSWKDNSAAESGYIIESSVGNNTSFQVIDSVGADVMNYSHRGLRGNTMYAYRVRAYHTLGDSYNPTVNYYSNEASATAIAAGTGLQATYYNNRDFTGKTATRTDSVINFNWQKTSPIAGIDPNTYSVRWRGQVLASYSQFYTFYTSADEEVRLWVNGKKLVDNWNSHAGKKTSDTISLAAGVKYDIVMEYAHNRRDSSFVQLFWSGASISKQIIPQMYLYPANEPATMATAKTGIEESPAFSIFPNPAYSAAHIQLGLHKAEQISVVVYNNLSGEVLRKEVLAQPGETISLPVSGLKAGMYVVIIQRANQRLAGKLLISR